MSVLDDTRRALLEALGRAYALEGLAIIWTTGIEGDAAKEVRSKDWPTTRPLPNGDGGDFAAGHFATRGQKRNPAVTARSSNLVLIDCDTVDGLAEIEALNLPATWTVRSSAEYKRHFWFRPPAEARRLPQVGFRFEQAGLSGDKERYLVCPPAWHPTGVEYAFLPGLGPSELPIAPLPLDVYESLLRRAAAEHEQLEIRPGAAEDPNLKIRTGQRRRSVFRHASMQRRWGLSEQATIDACMRFNLERCEPPLTLEQVTAQVHGAMKMPGGDELAATATPVFEGSPCRLDEVAAVFSRWLLLPDVEPVYAMLGGVAANYLPGSPVWLIIVSPPSSGKTELLGSLAQLPDVHAASTLTEASLLSGTPRGQRSAGAKGGLLKEVGDFGIVVLKDMGSLLSMRPDDKAEVFAALREVFDGSYVRYVGSDGGRQLAWQGKLGLIAGATPVLDRHHGVLSVMGERFLLCRLPEALEAQAERALAHTGDLEAQMRRELAEAVAGLFAGRHSEPRPLDTGERREIVGLAALVARARSPVERDRHTREVELVPGAEGPARLAVTLERLLAGLDTLGCARPTALRVIRRVALDSMPALRRRLLEQLCAAGGPVATPTLAVDASIPTNTARRALEDLAAYRLVTRAKQGQGQPDLWSVDDWTRERFQ